ncbi:MFS transporter [Synechococcus sp. PCC 6312]|uniref:MFS transporter n=1 Tax=Synechococcus sp. (strain ATCC 27167 / PCC 6312) TaxID=195253 RepID=UPI00029F343F|nr:MFS transporter [Synechococcus sp. PCC 6312]AFY59999.1 arabinose efflux permease family protein [Synechococcus sp. PCC 6312]
MLSPGPQPTSGGFLSLLHNRNFLKLWSGQIISQLGDKIFLVLLITLVVNYQAPAYLATSMASAVMVANTLPAVFFGSAAGIFVDRYPKRTILSVTNILRGLLVLAIPFLPNEFALLLLVAFLESILTQFFAPAEQAAIPLLVDEKNLLSANALFITTMMGSLVIGFAIGEPVLSWAQSWGKLGREFFVGGLYISAGLVLSWIRVQESVTTHDQKWQFIGDLKDGFGYLRKNKVLGQAMLQLTVLYCVFAALTVLAVGLAQEIGLKPNQFGFLLAGSGVGLILGAGILGQWGERWSDRPLPLYGFLSMAFVLLVFAFVDRLWLGLGLSVFLGIGASFIGVPMQTLIQIKTPPEMRGKVFGFQNNIVNIALSVPLALAGILADLVGLQAVLVGLGIVVAVAGIWAWQKGQQIVEESI